MENNSIHILFRMSDCGFDAKKFDLRSLSAQTLAFPRGFDGGNRNG